MRQRATGSVDPALTAAAAAPAAAEGHDGTTNSSSRIAAVPFHPPAAALLVSPAVDLSSSSVFARPPDEVAKLFEYDYVAKSEGNTDGGGECMLVNSCWKG
jgi:hypothetical protein